jgi:hypothetical protein
MTNKNEQMLTIIVNGNAVVVSAIANAALRTIIPQALHLSGNAGQPPDNWELRDASGNPLALDKKVGEFMFGPDAKLFLNLKAGVGG